MESIMEFFQTSLGIKLMISAGIILLIFISSIVTKRIIQRHITALDSRYRTRKFINFSAYFIAIIALLFTFSSHLTGVTVFLGVAGAGIAFALQEVIASAAGFMVIHFSNFYKVGDRVLVGGIKGDVIDIGILRTTLMEIGDWVDGDLYNGRMTRVANSFVFKEPVYNYSGDFPFLWDEIKVPIKTHCDYNFALEEFKKILESIQGDYAQEASKKWRDMTEKYMIEKAQVEPMVHLVFDENWITFSLRYVVDFKSRRRVKNNVSIKLLELIKNSGGRLEIASAAMEITAFPKVQNSTDT